jgi:hypothetical protein
MSNVSQDSIRLWVSLAVQGAQTTARSYQLRTLFLPARHQQIPTLNMCSFFKNVPFSWEFDPDSLKILQN